MPPKCDARGGHGDGKRKRSPSPNPSPQKKARVGNDEYIVVANQIAEPLIVEAQVHSKERWLQLRAQHNVYLVNKGGSTDVKIGCNDSVAGFGKCGFKWLKKCEEPQDSHVE